MDKEKEPLQERLITKSDKQKYIELQQISLNFVDDLERNKVGLSQSDAKTLLELIQIEIKYRYRMEGGNISATRFNTDSESVS